MENILNAAFIGCGTIALKKHLPLAAKNPNLCIKVLCDKNIDNARMCREKFGDESTLVTDDVDIIFGMSEIDVVFIATPNNLHSEYAVKALNAKQHVICEKPMADSVKNAEKMLAAALKNKKVLYISYQNRYTNQAQYVKRLCDEGFFEDIYYMKAYAVRRRAMPTWGGAGNLKIQGGGALIDIGSHAIDLSMWLSDNFSPAYVVGTAYHKITRKGSEANLWGSWDRESTVEDSAVGFIVMENGMTITVESSYAMNTMFEKEASIDLFGTGGGARLREKDEVQLVYELAGQMVASTNSLQNTPRSLTPGHRISAASEREHEAITKLLLSENTENISAKQALVTTKIVEALYVSAKEKRAVYLDGRNDYAGI